MVLEAVACKHCGQTQQVKPHRRTGYRCENCKRTFQLDYTKQAYEPGIKEQVIDMALNGSGIRDTAASAVRQSVAYQHEHCDEHT